MTAKIVATVALGHVSLITLSDIYISLLYHDINKQTNTLIGLGRSSLTNKKHEDFEFVQTLPVPPKVYKPK